MSRNFAGSGQYLTHAAGILTAPPITMACWVYKTNVTTDFLMSLHLNGGTSHHHSLWASNVATAASRTTTVTSASTTATLSTTAWNHVAGVWGSSTSRWAYLAGANGVQNTTSKVPSGINYFRLGSDGTASGLLVAKIAHAAIWNVALTAEEIALLGTQRVSPLAVRRDALVAYWPFMGRDTLDIDVVGRYSLTATGATADTAEPPQLWLPGKRNIILPANTYPTLSLPTVTSIGPRTATPRVTVVY